jgi:hypothetical protein
MDVFEGLLSGLGLRLSTGKLRIAGEVNGFGFISFHFARRYRPSSKRVLMHFFLPGTHGKVQGRGQVPDREEVLRRQGRKAARE